MLVDIIIDKLYPIAFMPVDKAIRDPPWNEQEEQIRADQWRVSTRLYNSDSTGQIHRRVGSPAR